MYDCQLDRNAISGSRDSPLRKPHAFGSKDFVNLSSGLVRGFFHWLRFTLERQKQRRELMNLSEHQLKDIGITRVQARTEATKLFWQN